MNAARFDRWLRTFSPTSRRAAVGGVASSVLAVFGDHALVGAGGCRKRKQSCSQGNPCCTTAGFNLQCKSGVCRCKTSFKDCNKAGGTCETNLRSDTNDCGKCGIMCGN